MTSLARVAIVAEHASARFGGEAALPLHYFRVLEARGRQPWLVVHARTRSELDKLYPGHPRICYVEDSWFHLLMWRLSALLPRRVDNFTTAYAMRIATQLSQRRIVRRLIRDHGVNIVHQPMPVSPREPSMMHGFGVPVLIGPMNGGIDFPKAFRRYQSRAVTALLGFARWLSTGLNHVMPGKLEADVLLVANERTRRALPRAVRGKVIELVENGVDLGIWSGRGSAGSSLPDSMPDFVYMGRLVDWKAVELLVRAFKRLVDAGLQASLTLLGDGPSRETLMVECRQGRLLADRHREPGKVYFAGWQSQAACAEYLAQACALVLPSLMECGGAVVLEAMAASRPVIATDWGGPADYVDPSCGFLVAPASAETMIDQLAAAMRTLITRPELGIQMGQAGRGKVLRLFDWEVKVDRVEALYAELLDPPAMSA